MKYHLNFKDLEEYQTAFQKKIDEFNDEIVNVFKACQNADWVGLGHDVTIQAIYNQIEELMKVSENLSKFIDFMNKAKESYSEGVNEVDTKFQEMKEIINAEKIKRGGM